MTAIRNVIAEALWKHDGFDLFADPESRTAKEFMPEYLREADQVLDALREAGQVEYGRDRSNEFVTYIEPAFPISTATHQRIVLPWEPVSSEEGDEG